MAIHRRMPVMQESSMTILPSIRIGSLWCLPFDEDGLFYLFIVGDVKGFMLRKECTGPSITSTKLRVQSGQVSKVVNPVRTSTSKNAEPWGSIILITASFGIWQSRHK